MAKYRRGKKMQPAPTTMMFQSPSFTGLRTFYIDISQCASLVNRRFYRQGLNWAVAGIRVVTQTGFEGYVATSRLPNTWVMSNAWEKGFRTWQKMNQEALAENPSVKPKFLDFKIYADSDHHDLGFVANLRPESMGPINAEFKAGEWVASKYVIPDDTVPGQTYDREIIATGPNYPGGGASGINAVSLIEGYANSRSLPSIQNPNTPDDAEDASGTTPENWMTAIFNEGTDQEAEVLIDLTTENDEAPYPYENAGFIDTQYPGGENQGRGLEKHDFKYINNATIGGTTQLLGGMFPCGLIRIDAANNDAFAAPLNIYLDLVPGHHRGYLCEPMTEM